MSNIIKMRVSTHPNTGQKYEFICDFQNASYFYKNELNPEERFMKMSDEQMDVMNSILMRVHGLKKRAYLGPITNDGMYWEFDLVNEKNKMIEIEGINMIDDEVISILSDLEILINQPLGVVEFNQNR